MGNMIFAAVCKSSTLKNVSWPNTLPLFRDVEMQRVFYVAAPVNQKEGCTWSMELQQADDLSNKKDVAGMISLNVKKIMFIE